GIRDKLVTGVQTCALPISPRSSTRRRNSACRTRRSRPCRAHTPSPCAASRSALFRGRRRSRRSRGLASRPHPLSPPLRVAERGTGGEDPSGESVHVRKRPLHQLFPLLLLVLHYPLERLEQ